MHQGDGSSDRPTKKQRKPWELEAIAPLRRSSLVSAFDSVSLHHLDSAPLLPYMGRQLINPQGTRDSHSIVEVKPNYLRSNDGYDPFLRQMDHQLAKGPDVLNQICLVVL
jgi:hypothetical protein